MSAQSHTVTLWDGSKKHLWACPFCGGYPEMQHIGNDFGRVKKIKIKCPDCRVERIDATMKFDFKWLENVAIKNWNRLE